MGNQNRAHGSRVGATGVLSMIMEGGGKVGAKVGVAGTAVSGTAVGGDGTVQLTNTAREIKTSAMRFRIMRGIIVRIK